MWFDFPVILYLYANITQKKIRARIFWLFFRIFMH